MKHPNRRRITVAIALGAWLLTAGAAQAQGPEPDDERWHPRWGDWSLSFFLPDGGGPGFGLWRQTGTDVALGLTTEASVGRVERESPAGTVESSQVRLALGPALKRYWWQEGPVSPFLRLGAQGVYQRNAGGGRATWRLGGGLSLGLGAEWFPTRGIGIGGHTGVDASYFWTTDDDDIASDEMRFDAHLFTSALSVQLYF